MGNDWDFWIHGVNVQPEVEDKSLEIRRMGAGARVRQKLKTNNWFHFAIPTPTCINDDFDVEHWQVVIRFLIKWCAWIDMIHVWVGDKRIIGPKEGAVNLKKDKTRYEINIPHDKIRDKSGSGGGLLICVHVQFEADEFEDEKPKGEIDFIGAAAKFNL